MKRLWVAAGAALIVSSLFVQSAPVQAGGRCYEYSELDKKLFKKTNKSRTNHGVGKLTLDPHLSKVARKHTKEMINQSSLEHTGNSVLGNRVTRWIVLGENVGKGDSLREIQKAFMDSSGHKANILDSSYKFGGMSAKKHNGKVWSTVVFEASNNPGTTLQMPDC